LSGCTVCDFIRFSGHRFNIGHTYVIDAISYFQLFLWEEVPKSIQLVWFFSRKSKLISCSDLFGYIFNNIL